MPDGGDVLSSATENTVLLRTVNSCQVGLLAAPLPRARAAEGGPHTHLRHGQQITSALLFSATSLYFIYSSVLYAVPYLLGTPCYIVLFLSAFLFLHLHSESKLHFASVQLIVPGQI